MFKTFFLRLFVLGLAVVTLFSFSACSAKEKKSLGSNSFDDTQDPNALSDNLNERFQQLFFYELDNPNVEQPFPPDSSSEDIFSGNGSTEPPARLFKSFWFNDSGIMKGAFFLIKPTASYISVGLDQRIVEGIYDLTFDFNQEEELYTFNEFSMKINLLDCSLQNLDLVYKNYNSVSREQHIPLSLKESDGEITITADFSKAPSISVEKTSDANFVFSGTLSYQGIEYSFETSL